jgi:hypothetical protein
MLRFDIITDFSAAWYFRWAYHSDHIIDETNELRTFANDDRDNPGIRVGSCVSNFVKAIRILYKRLLKIRTESINIFKQCKVPEAKVSVVDKYSDTKQITLIRWAIRINNADDNRSRQYSQAHMCSYKIHHTFPSIAPASVLYIIICQPVHGAAGHLGRLVCQRHWRRLGKGYKDMVRDVLLDMSPMVSDSSFTCNVFSLPPTAETRFRLECRRQVSCPKSQCCRQYRQSMSFRLTQSIMEIRRSSYVQQIVVKGTECPSIC